MPTPFGQPANNVVAVVGAGGYVAGSGTLTLAAGQGAQFPALTAGWFYRITVVQQAHAYDPLMTAANYTIFKATSRTGDVFSGVTAIEGTTDRNYVGGDVVDVRTTAATLSDIQAALNAAELTNATVCTGRLTLTSGDPIEVSGVGTILYFTPFGGADVGLYDGATQWNLLSFPQISLAIPGSTGLYDVFAYNNAGVVALEFSAAWTNSGFGLAAAGTRNQALVRQDGVWVKSGATTRRYLGTVYSSSGTATDTPQVRTLWNYANRLPKKIYTNETAASWSDATAAWRLVNNNANGKSFFSVVVGVKENLATVYAGLTAAPAAGNTSQTSFWYDDSVQATDFVVNSQTGVLSSALSYGIVSPDIGYHNYTWKEIVSGGTATHYNTNSGVTGVFPC